MYVELKKVNLKIKFQFPKKYCALLLNKSSARIKYNISVQLGLIDVGYTNYVETVIQNMSPHPTQIPTGTAVAQLLLIKSKVPSFTNSWPHTDKNGGGFGSTGQTFEKILKLNFMSYLFNKSYLSHH